MRHATLPHPFHACTNGHGPTCEAFDCCHPCPMEAALEAHLAFLERTDSEPPIPKQAQGTPSPDQG